MVRLSEIVRKGGAAMNQTMCIVAFRAAALSNAAPGNPWEDYALLT
jgi:hypothetical protein